ncbi:hypothetical protein [Nonomuraea sp. NPDC050786]|uniref:hypothetical protein n=1 Tax=Nonomuraea sp. NPDC050786 TaxID=3154840 RepID=UPI003405D69A
MIGVVVCCPERSARVLGDPAAPAAVRDGLEDGRATADAAERLLAPGGRHEYAPVRVVDVATADVLVMDGAPR